MINKIETYIDKLHDVSRANYQKLPGWVRKALNVLLLLGVITFLALMIYNMSKTPFQLI
jgi:hypothetical protein